MDLSFTPTNRIARASSCNTGIKGLGVGLPTSFPAGNIGSGADYSVDFSSFLAAGEYVVYALFSVSSGATLAWGSIYGNYATAWVGWQTSGWKKITASIVTSLDNNYTASGGINIGCPTLVTTTPPEWAPNAYVFNEIYVADADGNALILG